MIISSIAGITLCCLCLVSLTWAWFEDGVSSGRNSISTATFWSEMTIEKVETNSQSTLSNDDSEQKSENNAADGENQLDDQNQPDGENNGANEFSAQGGVPEKIEDATAFTAIASKDLTPAVQANPVVIPDNKLDGSDSSIFSTAYALDGSCVLKNFAAGEYKFTIVPQGTAQTVGGYIVVESSEQGAEKLYTEQLMIGDTFVFILEVEAGVDYKISCVWGSMPETVDKENIFENELDKEKEDDASKAADDTVSDTDKVVSNDTTEVVSNDTTEVVSNDTTEVVSNDTTEVVSNDTSSIEDESVSSTEQTEFSNENSTDTASSTEQIESSDVSSVESEAEGSEESEAEISQGDNTGGEETSAA